MKTLFIIIILSFSLIAFSCNHDPEPINFNSDQCAHCKMTIEDTRFGAEIITEKGKIYKFDAVECMLRFVFKGTVSEGDVEKFLVIDFSQPSILVNATASAYLISQNLPSPMGANLSAFLNKSSAENQKSTSGGDLYDWSELKNKFKK
ncbi:MAG: nitrous oxide reductase accessory protein NosL [Ignavibacteriae bacterium]|nr:nitrous oxide reductase accessory protein NosL [Ignavibacteriota bacterium]